MAAVSPTIITSLLLSDEADGRFINCMFPSLITLGLSFYVCVTHQTFLQMFWFFHVFLSVLCNYSLVKVRDKSKY